MNGSRRARLSNSARTAALIANSRARESALRFAASSRELLATVPAEARKELRGSLWRLRKIRSPHSAAQALEDELVILLRVVTPILAEHPLPVQRVGTARAVVATSAAMAATGEQIELIAGLFSAGVSIPGTLPIALAAIFLSIVIELYVATSLRVHMLREVGAVVDPTAVAAEVAWAMGGAGGRPGRAVITRKVVTRLAARMASRIGRGLIPIAGAAYSGWDAQRTVGAISTLGVPSPPDRTGSDLPALNAGQRPSNDIDSASR